MSQNLITFDDCRGGMSDLDPAFLLPNQVAEAYNLTYWNSRLGARRNGISSLSTTATQATTSMHVYTPDSTVANEKAIVTEVTGIGATEWKHYTPGFAARTAITPNPADIFDANVFTVSATNLSGKLHLAAYALTPAMTALDRMHVWDGTTLRRSGLVAPSIAPTGANSGGAGSLTGTRYYRTRNTVQVAGVTILRSEPSPALTAAPSGTNASYTVTKSGITGENETHWELEGSADNATYYRISTLPVATTTYADTLGPTGFAVAGILSATIGDYTPLGCARYVISDRDRIVAAGNYFDAAKDATITWTPVGNDTTGVGNDERVPTSTNNVVTCDGRDGGPITALVAFDSEIVAFKESRTYLLTHTGQRASAYRVRRISKVFGALRGSVSEGVDAAGNPTLYFYDKKFGPMSYGTTGFTKLAPHLQRTLLSVVDTDPALRVTIGEFYPPKQEMWWYLKGQVANGLDDNYPQMRLVYNVESGGFNFHTLTEEVYSSVYWETLGYAALATRNSSPAYAIGRCDNPAATTDLGNTYRAYTLSRTIEQGALTNKMTLRGAMLRALPLSGVSVTLTPIKDYAAETTPIDATALLTATASERYVVKQVDDLRAGECSALQIRFGDPSARSVASWSLDRLALNLTGAGSSA